jgi:hypothetical protein
MKFLSATSALAFAALAALAAPQAKAASIASLAGPWAATIIGTTACGATSMYATFTLNSAGTGNATTTYHTANCGDSTSTYPFSFSSLNSAGAGAANLSCGSGCGWALNIQLLPGGKLFTLVDVSPGNPNNYIEGTAVFQ